MMGAGSVVRGRRRVLKMKKGKKERGRCRERSQSRANTNFVKKKQGAEISKVEKNRSTERALFSTMRRRRIALLSSLLVAAVLSLVIASAARAEKAKLEAVLGQRQMRTASSAAAAEAAAASSSSSSSSPRPLPLATSPNLHRRRSLKCDPSMEMVSISAKVVTDDGKGTGGGAFRPLNSTTSSLNTTSTTGGAVSDLCSQAEAIIEANSTNPLNIGLVLHARQWTEDEIIDTAMRRRGRRVAALTMYDLAAASPLMLPSLVRFRPITDNRGNEIARVMDIFADGTIPANLTVPGIPASVAALEPVVTSSSGALVRKTISPRGLREMLARPELVLLAMAAVNHTVAPGIAANAAGPTALRINKEDYNHFLMRDSDIDVCEDSTLRGDAAKPLDRLFSIADTNKDGFLDAVEIRGSNLVDAAVVWTLAADTDGDGLLSAKEIADGLPLYGDLQPRTIRSRMRASPEQQRRIRELTALAAVAAYDADGDGALSLDEMRVYSSDYTRRSMGKSMVPVW